MPDEQGNRDCLFLKKRGNPGNNHTINEGLVMQPIPR